MTPILNKLPFIPIQEWSAVVVDWMNNNLEVLFNVISQIITGILSPIQYVLFSPPAIAIIAVLAVVGYLLAGWRLSIFVTVAFLIIAAMDFWEPAMTTLSLVISATILSLIAGIPLGIWKSHSRTVSFILDPILDFMQTMPLFVYLIPAVLFFSIGNIPGIVATFIFSTPPAVRLTSLGIEQISRELLEAGHSFGASKGQFLRKVELPLAMPSIMAGVNQTIMLSLSMVVVASMIGAEGLGQEVLRGITRLNVGQGIAGGLGIVFLAMILDRLTRNIWRQDQT